ncbi:villin-4-like [Dorcoceras hygrometricum]|uniref:Villin-4-like n=1 Tax=Dorcoceras hygrometricum TaxID=472368 RepID=A0A2Z7AGB6_9LAMI|nr:villin-4-like [Dorcoceras hygrometricum]
MFRGNNDSYVSAIVGRLFDKEQHFLLVQRDSGDIQEVDITGDEEVDLVSSDVSTVYRSPSPIFQEVDSIEHDLQFALGPAIFPSVSQEERLYFVQSPASSPATYQPQESSSSSTHVSMHFDSADIPLNAQADSQASAPVDLLRQSLQDACRVQERQGVTQAMQMNDLKKGLLAPVATVFQDLMAIKRKIAADLLILSTQIGDIVDHIRGGDAKKGEIGSSSRRPPPIRVERRPLPTPANQGESSSGLGRVPSVEEAAEMIREADRQADRREREREGKRD